MLPAELAPADLVHTAHLPLADVALRLGTAALLGLMLGLNRELRGKAAGLRTHTLLSVSAAVATLVALELHYDLAADGQGNPPDPIRAIQGVAQAIGLICAGIIIQGRGTRVRNLTTAATLWMAASLGLACGAGFYGIALLSGGIALVLLLTLSLVERRFFGDKEEDATD
ncbi:MgtC/SapB family protein [Rhodocista pekingensis]|uniref:Protein MgtC n=1 Tax=Rhodocista pekingensis TaxID=201185 RepID=A0ABW2KUR3_9PROT